MTDNRMQQYLIVFRQTSRQSEICRVLICRLVFLIMAQASI